MTFPFKTPRGIIVLAPPRKSSRRLQAVWTRDPKTGRLVQTWRDSDDAERSCSVRPRGPRLRGRTEELPRAA